MTRKDYIRAATLIKPDVDEKDKKKFIKVFAEFFKADNGRFDKDKFESACLGT